MPDTLPRLNLDDARAVLGKMTPGPLRALTFMIVSSDNGLFAKCESASDAEGIVYCVNNFDALIEEVAQLRAALREIADKLPCDEPCVPEDSRCGTCGSRKFRWCAGCIARAALSPAPDRVNDRGRQQLEQIAALQERHALGQMSDADLAHAIKEICNVNK